MKCHALVAAAALTLAAHTAAASVEVRLQEQVIADGTLPVLHAVITNTSTGTLAIRTDPAPVAAIQLLTGVPDRCSVARLDVFHPHNVTRASVRLKPGEAIAVPVNTTFQYPLGLRPGKYRVTLTYDDGKERASVRSELVVAAPTGEAGKVHEGFLGVCRAALSASLQGGHAAVAFAQRNRGHALIYPLLQHLAVSAAPEVREAANDELLRSPNPQASVRANAERIEKQRLARERGAGYQREYERRIGASTPDALEFRLMTAISKPATFREYELFLKRHPESFFAAEAVNRMIVAVQNGVVPIGLTAETARVDLYRRLLREYPDSYYAGEAREDRHVQELLARSK